MIEAIVIINLVLQLYCFPQYKKSVTPDRPMFEATFKSCDNNNKTEYHSVQDALRKLRKLRNHKKS